MQTRSADTRRSLHRHALRRPFRSGLAAVAVVVGVALLTGCEANRALRPVEIPGADWAVLMAMNTNGTAVGNVHVGDRFHAIVYDIGSGTTTVLPDPPPSTELPSGGEFKSGIDVNDAGLIFGNVVTPTGEVNGIYDPADGSWQFVECDDLWFLPAGDMLSNSGLLTCSDRVFDSVAGQYLDVTMPAGCAGEVRRVNAQGIAVGSCRNGPEPLFATDVATGVTVGFGSAEGLPEPSDDETLPGALTDTGWLAVPGIVNSVPQALVYRIPADFTGAAPQSVELGLTPDAPSGAAVISPAGTLALAQQIGDDWFHGTYDVTTGRIRAWDLADLPDVDDEYVNTVVTGIDDAGRAVGYQVNLPDGTLIQPFATAPTG